MYLLPLLFALGVADPDVIKDIAQFREDILRAGLYAGTRKLPYSESCARLYDRGPNPLCQDD